LAYDTNREIGGVAPSEYLKKIEQKHNIVPAELDSILRSHLIEPEHLRNDDFEAFYATRQDCLAKLVSDAMKKPVIEDAGTNEPEKEPDDDIEMVEEAIVETD
jgi:hypothetical protein